MSAGTDLGQIIFSVFQRRRFYGRARIWCLTPVRKRRKRRAAMKIHRWVIWLLVVVILASEALLFSALRQKQAAQVGLQMENQRVEKLQTELDQLQSSNADAENAEISRLRADDQDLPRLRNQVTQLQMANQKLSWQLQATSDFAEQQQARLQQLAAENQQVRAVAQQTLTQAEAAVDERNECLNNLRQIDAAKNQWALENNKTSDAMPTVQDLLPYLRDQIFPVCPSGGTYTIGAVGVAPTCSIPGHALP
jgi:chromosome segregation ATPase